MSVEVKAFNELHHSAEPYDEVIHTAARFFKRKGDEEYIEVLPDDTMRGWVYTMPSMENAVARGPGAHLLVQTDLVIAD